MRPDRLVLPETGMIADAQIVEIVRQSGSLQKFILGENVRRFEEGVKARLGARHAVAVASEAGAITVALMATEIGPGDEVIIPAFGSAAAAAAVVTVGSTPVFVDVDARTMLMDAARVEEKITARTRALMPAHMFSCMADMPALMGIARMRGLLVIENAGALFGAHLNGISAGSRGDIGTFSFSPGAVLSACGEGGMIVTNNDDLAVRCRLIRNHGQQEGVRFIHKRIGLNSRMDEIQAMLLTEKLVFLASSLAQRARIAQIYHRLLATLTGRIVLPPAGTEGRCYHTFTLQTPDREQLCSYLHAQGIETRVHFSSITSRHAGFAGSPQLITEFPNAERASLQTFGIPLYDGMTDEQVSIVAKALLAFPQF
jgi:dTDP-4-amino-4,6-dideoxygalactose transaminase